jgi:ankyrin repeat protein
VPAIDFNVVRRGHLRKSANLFYAVKSNQPNEVETYLLKNANPTLHDGLDQNTLMWACWNGNYEMVVKLFEYKEEAGVPWIRRIISPRPNTNKKNRFGYTALFCAAYGGNWEIIDYLVKKGAKVINIQDNNKENILHKIAKSNNTECLSKFIDRLTGVNTEWNRLDNKNISENFKKESMALLINEQDKTGYTPLHYAVLGGNVRMVDLLLKNGADIMLATEDDDIYPLYTAYKQKNYSVFRSLSEKENPPGISNIYDIPTPVRDSDGGFLTLEKLLINEENSIDGEAIIKPLNPFFSVYEKRTSINWKPGMSLENNEYKKLQEDFCDAVKENNVSKAKNIEKKLYNLSDVDFEQDDKSVLEAAIDNNSYEMLAYLLENNVQYMRGNENSVFQYAISSLDYEKNKIEAIRMVKWMLDNHRKYSGYSAYGFMDSGGKSPWRRILESPTIQELCGWEWVKGMLETYRRSGQSFNSEEVFMLCGKEKKFSNELLDYFMYLITQPIQVENEPLLNYFLNKKYFHGIDQILKDKILCDALEITTRYGTFSSNTFKVTLEAKLKNPDEDKDQYVKYKEAYEKMYEVSENNVKNSRFSQKLSDSGGS